MPFTKGACRALALVLLLLASLAPVSSWAQCRPVATIPLRIVEGFPVLSATIRGQPASLLLDTGAQAPLILPEAQSRLQLTVLPGTVPLLGTGGERVAPVVLLDGVQLGQLTLPPTPAPVAPLPAIPHVDPPLAGLLGAELLERFDLDLDATNGRLALFLPGTCAPAAGDIIPLTIGPEREALLPVRIDGVPLTALLDSGSRATLIGTAAAHRLGLSADASANTARGVDGEHLPVGHTRVRTLAVGDDVIRNAPVSIAALQLGRADMLLGLDYLRQRRVWISFRTARIVIALPTPRP